MCNLTLDTRVFVHGFNRAAKQLEAWSKGMPNSPGTVCSTPGCGGVRHQGVCSRCGPKRRAKDERKSAAARGYDWKWRNEDGTGAADYWLAEHPLCAECQWYGLTVAATLVDHKRPHKEDRELFWDQDNWQSLCGKCHNKKTNREKRAMSKYVVCGAPGSGKTTWVKQRAKTGDLVFDADYLVSQLFTTPLHQSVDFGFPMVERLRETVIDWLLNYPDRTAYVIQSDRDAAQRTAERLGAELIDCGAEQWAKGRVAHAH